MVELFAQGEKSDDRWSRILPPDQPMVLGRSDGDWRVPWDPWVSRRHAEMTWSKGKLRVRLLPEVRNPLFFRGKEERKCEVGPGEFFIVGQTVFTVRSQTKPVEAPADPASLLHSQTILAEDLKNWHFRDAPHRIDVLSRLPEVISSAADDTELLQNLVQLLLSGISRADVISIVQVIPDQDNGPEVVTLIQEGRTALSGAFRPSHQLAREALVQQHNTVLHVWGSNTPSDQNSAYTQQVNTDWAYCTPVIGEACQGWGIYVAGRQNSPPAALMGPWNSSELGDDLKFTELVASVVSSLRHVQLLQRKQSLLSHFFSPAMLPVLTSADPETALKPRETEVTVLFCDLRGFSKTIESGADDLMALLQRVSQALGVMTRNILEKKGVIADFQGDAAMGFWGWPLVLEDRISLACQAALRIRQTFQEFAQDANHPLAGFQAGIGIASGSAVAGQIGPSDQAKVTVFGPVVNLAARLEAMTKLLRVPILLDEATTTAARQQMSPDQMRCRRLALVKPYGLDTPVLVSELLPPAESYPLLSDENIEHYESGLDAFLQGDWTRAYEQLHLVPPQDRGKDLLLSFILQNNHTAPPGWSGVISLESKS